MKILAISGSTRENSSNTNILKHIASFIPQDIEYLFYKGLEHLPHYNPALDIQPAPETVADLRMQLQQSDAVIICTPEYAFGVPGSLKNMLDWTVSSAELTRKPICLITASSVGKHAHASLLLTFTALDADTSENRSLLIPFIRSKMNDQGAITDPETAGKIRSAVDALLTRINSSS